MSISKNVTGCILAGYLQDYASRCWTVEYYQCYFDVDTKTVLQRCYSTLLPFSSYYLSMHLSPADLYSPFWILSTLIFTSSSPALPPVSPPTSLTPLLILWVALGYLGVGKWSIVEAIAIWGYGMFVWIPISILAVTM
ncbi:Protein YIP [Mycena venus]|uniref:Protein YIP n=1 Tax=Mycena venus TaxID=2733690 RepID=A0A8H7CMA3_9AGAR|nr:Protein YIP [Mycena venus]